MLSGMANFRRRELLLGGTAFAAARTLLGENARVLAPGYRERQAMIDDLVTANHILFAQGIFDAFGHVSVRPTTGGATYFMARSIAPAQVTADDIIEYDLNGNPVDKREVRSAYLERFIHNEIYRARPQVRSIVHCHAASLIPFGITGVPLRPVFHNSSFVGEGIPIFEIREGAGDTDMLVGNAALGRALAGVLGDKPAALMRGHGAVIVANTLIDAVARSVYLEENARIQAQAMAMGQNVNYLSPGEVQKRGSANEFSRAWELWKAQVSRP
jgi:HCOMODA/2-hydroxy-3-carboxy-muconic semialdehyde decarboxylase